MCMELGVMSPTGVVENRVEKGIEPKSLSMIVLDGPFVFDQERRVELRAMAEILEMRLLQELREELGGTYSVNVNESYQKYPRPQLSTSIQLGNSQARTRELRMKVIAE